MAITDETCARFTSEEFKVYGSTPRTEEDDWSEAVDLLDRLVDLFWLTRTAEELSRMDQRSREVPDRSVFDTSEWTSFSEALVVRITQRYEAMQASA